MITEWQSHSGVVNTSTTPKVQYSWSEMPSGANHSRLTSMTYPDGCVLTFNYSSGLNSSISRLSSLSDTTGTLESYSYLGLGTVVIRSHPQPTIDLTMVKQGLESVGDAGDQYTGLDRFGRVVDQRWINTTSNTATDRFQYGYDRDSNRLFRDNLVNTAFGELYSYDGLNQLVSFDRGTLNGGRTAISGSPARSQDWDYDALGNLDSVTTNGGSPETRTANAQNEITSISGLTTPTYDANGNMTTDQNGLKYYYDAWNRLVTVKNSAGTTTLTSYQYDGTNRRVSENPGAARDLYYSSGWQVLEERVGGNAQNQYVWSPVYVDAQVLRDRDTDANGSLDERLWLQQDANWNVTAVLDGSGTVQERNVYDAYGAVTIYSAAYSARGSSLYSQTHFFQGRPADSITSLYDNRMRWYSPTLDRAIQPDPLKFEACDSNLYRWVNNSPVRHLDPSGLQVYAAQTSARPSISGSKGWGHYSIYVVDKATCRMVMYTGTGTHDDALGQMVVGAYVIRDWAPSRDPIERGKWNVTTIQEIDSILNQIRNVLIFSSNFMAEMAALDKVFFTPLKQVRHYNARNGPNSNTYAYQLLHLANMNPPTRIPYGPGWDYRGEFGYGIRWYTSYGEEVIQNGRLDLGDPQGLGIWLNNPPPGAFPFNY